MKILFICKYNRLRSKIAESLFNYYNKNPKHEAKSAGIRMYLLSPYVVEKAKKLLEQRGCKVEHDNSNLVNDYLQKWADKIIIVADDVPIDGFDKKRVEKWDVEDMEEKNEKKLIIKINEIEEKIKELVKRIG